MPAKLTQALLALPGELLDLHQLPLHLRVVGPHFAADCEEPTLLHGEGIPQSRKIADHPIQHGIHLAPELDTYTEAHLDECQTMLKRALEASYAKMVR